MFSGADAYMRGAGRAFRIISKPGDTSRLRELRKEIEQQKITEESWKATGTYIQNAMAQMPKQ